MTASTAAAAATACQRITNTNTVSAHTTRQRHSKWMLTFFVVGFCFSFIAAVHAVDETKPTQMKPVQPSPSSASPKSVTDEIYIDDEGIDGSGGHGGIHDDLEKEADYSGSGFGPDDEDSSTDHNHRSNSNKHNPSISSAGSGGQSSSNSNTGLNQGNTIGKDPTTHKDTPPSSSGSASALPFDNDNNLGGGVNEGSGDGDHDTDYDDDDDDNDDDEDGDHDRDHDRDHDQDSHHGIGHNIDHDKAKKPFDNDGVDEDDEDIDDELYTEVTDPNVDSKKNSDPITPVEGNNNKEVIVPKNNDFGLDLDHTNRNDLPTDSNTHIGSGVGAAGNEVLIMNTKNEDRTASFFAQPGILAAVIGGAVVGLLCAILVVMFIVYRMRKKDEGSYALDEPKRSPAVNSYAKNGNNREFYA